MIQSAKHSLQRTTLSEQGTTQNTVLKNLRFQTENQSKTNKKKKLVRNDSTTVNPPHKPWLHKHTLSCTVCCGCFHGILSSYAVYFYKNILQQPGFLLHAPYTVMLGSCWKLFPSATSCVLVHTGPFGFPLIGNLPDIITKGLPVLSQELEARFGPIFKFWVASDPWIVIADPDIARQLGLRFMTRPGFDKGNILPIEDVKISNLGLFGTSE